MRRYFFCGSLLEVLPLLLPVPELPALEGDEELLAPDGDEELPALDGEDALPEELGVDELPADEDELGLDGVELDDEDELGELGLDALPLELPDMPPEPADEPLLFDGLVDDEDPLDDEPFPARSQP